MATVDDDIPPPPPPPPPVSKGPPPLPIITISPPPNGSTPSPPPPPAPATPPPSAAAASPSAGVVSDVSAALPRSTTNSRPSPTSGSNVSALAAMLQNSMMRPAQTIPERASNVDSDSDDEDDRPSPLASVPPLSPPGMHKKLSSSGSSASGSSFSQIGYRWDVDKANKYGLKDHRVVVLSVAAHAIRFFTPGEGGKMKAEIPLNQIAATRRKEGEDPKMVEMTFKEERRSYELYFKTEEEAADFERKMSAELDSNPSASASGRQYAPSVQRSTISAAGSAHHSSSGSLSVPLTGRPSSESVAIHSEVVPDISRAADPATAAPVEDHNAYLDYQVQKKNRFGMKQTRILVINSVNCSMLLLDEKRKFKKEFPLPIILSVEIPKSKGSDEAQAYIVFHKSADQKPFHLFFADTLDRLHFCERLVALSPHELSIKDESDQAEEDSSLRFGILKINKVGVKKKRIIVLRPRERVLRSFNREKSYKDVEFQKILKVEKPLLDRCRLNIFLQDRPHPLILIFPDTVSRERFVCQANYIRNVIEEEMAAAAAVAAGLPKPAALANATLSIFIGTWNLGNAPFTYDSLTEFIPPMKYDLYVIGLQECSKGDRDQWLLELRAHIQQNWKASASGSASKPGSVEDDQDQEQPYALLGVVKLWEIVMMVLIRRPLAAKVSNICMDTVATGVGDIMGNKGGVGLSFTYADNTLAFIATHLAARSERVVQRAENYMKIIKQMQLGLPGVDMLAQNDHVFWLGDLNYRNELEFSDVCQLVAMKDWKLLCQYDQLLAQMQKQLVFCGFQEGPIRFAPTYRWERKENTFSNKKFQAPSWTDRVLWHSLPGLADLHLDSYSSAPNVMGSDHRPVFATFTLQCRPPYVAKLPKACTLPIRILNSHNTNLAAPTNPLLTEGGGAGSTATGTEQKPGPPPLPPATGAKPGPPPLPTSSTVPTPAPAAASSPDAAAGAVSPSTPQHRATNLSVPSAASPKSLQLLMGVPKVSTIEANGANGAPPAISGRASIGGPNPNAPTTSSKASFTPYQFTPEAAGPVFVPPLPSSALLAARPPLLGNTKEFTIVMQSVKVSFGSSPRGDLTLTCSAPFLAHWPTTTAVSYQFGEQVGSHWDEIVLSPFIHDLYYLYNRHLMLVCTVPSDTSNANQQNQEQTGVGTQIGTSCVGLGTVCANLFNVIATLKPPAVAPKVPVPGASPLQFNPFAKPPAAASPPGSSGSGANANTGCLQVNPNSPGLTGDQGGYYFLEPIYREGLYAGQIEGRIFFRYK